MIHPECQYLNALRDTLDHGVTRSDRTGVGTVSQFGVMFRWDLSQYFPLFTSRFIAPRIGIEEMLFFMRGETDTKLLEEKNINIWKGNTRLAFLEKRGLGHLPEGSLGKLYGYQMRNFGGTEESPGFDQLQYVIDSIKTDPDSRRHVLSYYNPLQAHEGVLFPCHIMWFFQVANGKLNGMMVQRSGDSVLGVPTNTQQSAFFMHVIAKLTNLEVGELVHQVADFHIYLNHIEGVKELIAREPKPFPQLRFKKDFSTLEEALSLTYDDVEIVGYEHCGKMKFEMAV